MAYLFHVGHIIKVQMNMNIKKSYMFKLDYQIISGNLMELRIGKL